MECTVRDVALENVETRAKRRVSYFLIAFMVSGFFSKCKVFPVDLIIVFLNEFHYIIDILLCNELMLIDVVRLIQGETLDTVIYTNHQNWMHKLFYITLCLQVYIYEQYKNTHPPIHTHTHPHTHTHTFSFFY